MTGEIIAERLTDKTCDKHPGTYLVEMILRSDKLKNDWLLAICPRCHEEGIRELGLEEEPT